MSLSVDSSALLVRSGPFCGPPGRRRHHQAHLRFAPGLGRGLAWSGRGRRLSGTENRRVTILKLVDRFRSTKNAFTASGLRRRR